jgi:hypothetical protein
MPIQANTADLSNWILYDRLTAAQATTTAAQYQMFVTPYNQGTKTKADTNLSLPRQLEAPQWFNCQSIGFEFAPDTWLPDVTAFLKAYYFEFWVGNKIYAEGPLECAQSGYGLYGAFAATGTNATPITQASVVSNGVPQGLPSYNLTLPPGLNVTDAYGNAVTTDGIMGVTILQSQVFYVNLYSTAGILLAATAAGGVGMSLRCLLTGILSRGVQ